MAGLDFKLVLSYTYHEHYHSSRISSGGLRVLTYTYLAYCANHAQCAVAMESGGMPARKFPLLRLNLEVVLMEIYEAVKAYGGWLANASTLPESVLDVSIR